MLNNSLSILSGDRIPIDKNLVIKHPKLEVIKSYGESLYNTFITTFCSAPFDMASSLYRADIDYEDLDEYGLFNLLFPMIYYAEDSENFRAFVKEFFMIRGVLRMQKIDDKFVYIDNATSKVMISSDNIAIIKDTLRMITGYSNKKIEVFKNPFSKRMYLEDLIETEDLDAKNPNSQHSTITFAELVGGVVLSTSYKYNEVWDLFLYQFHSCTRMLLRREEYNHVMVGIYSGNIDGKKINKEKIFWLSK